MGLLLSKCQIYGLNKSKSLLILIFILISHKGLTQNTYDSLVDKGDSLKKLRQYKNAIPFYEAAFKKYPVREFDYYSLARCYGRLTQRKAALHILNKLFELKYENLSKIPNDSAFYSLHTMKQWNRLVKDIYKHQELLLNYRDTLLITTLVEMHKKDQEFRTVFDSLVRIGSTDEKLKGEISYKISMSDSVNIKALIAIIEQKGWPGVNLVGDEGNLAAFLILQHSSTPVQKKYIQLVEHSVKQGFTPKYLYAYLIDRILIRDGKPQKYGTQLEFNSQTGRYEVMLIESAEKVNGLRRAIGLPALQSYIDIVNKK